jgi:uncharacterized membrane protein
MNVRCIRNESGVVAPLVATMLLGLLAVAALVVDGGMLFAARRDLQGLADGAARAGAMAVDIETLRESGKVRLTPADAEAAAHEYLRTAGFPGTSSVSADILSVAIHLSDARSTVMMGLLGIDGVRVEARALARPRTGIESVEG